MDNSISKALIMVASVLLAMIVIAFIARTFMQMGNWSSVREDEKLTQQKEEFNREFEVYDKDLMYGVDVISCLNKAKDNNEKLEGNRSEKVDTSYAITIEFTLKKGLEESIIVYHMNSNTKKEEECTTAPTVDKIRLNDFFSPSSKVKSLSDELNWNSYMQTLHGQKSNIKAGTYTLSHNGSNDTSSAEVKALLECTDEVKVTKKNNVPNATPTDEKSWTKATWETIAYDLKTRKFKCESLDYSTQTGRVNKIVFTEF